jgi:hypothetical protein
VIRSWLLPLDVPVGLGRDDARQRAAEELSKAKYGGRPEWLEEAAERAARFVELLVELYLRLTGGRPGGEGVSWGFLLAVAILVAGLVLVVWKVGLPRWRRRTQPGSLALDSRVAAEDYRSLAQEHAARGDWQAAVRDRFRALVRDLETRTILQVRPARTAWEAAWSASTVLPESRDALVAGADLFNRVVYGDQRAEPADYAQMSSIDDAVRQAADRVDLAALEPAPG